jgi:hypothetical protein
MYGAISDPINRRGHIIRFLKLAEFISFSKRATSFAFLSVQESVCFIFNCFWNVECSVYSLPYRFVLFCSFVFLECCFLFFFSSYPLMSSCTIYYAGHSSSCYHFPFLHMFLRSLILLWSNKRVRWVEMQLLAVRLKYSSTSYSCLLLLEVTSDD